MMQPTQVGARMREIEPLDDHRLFFLSTWTEEGGRVLSYSIDVEKAEDSHYTFTREAMNAFDGYLTTRFTGTTLVDRLAQFVSSSSAAESEIRDLVGRLGLEVQQYHFDSYD